MQNKGGSAPQWCMLTYNRHLKISRVRTGFTPTYCFRNQWWAGQVIWLVATWKSLSIPNFPLQVMLAKWSSTHKNYPNTTQVQHVKKWTWTAIWAIKKYCNKQKGNYEVFTPRHSWPCTCHHPIHFRLFTHLDTDIFTQSLGWPNFLFSKVNISVTLLTAFSPQMWLEVFNSMHC